MFQQNNDPIHTTKKTVSPEDENKGVGLTQSITRLKPNGIFVEGTEDQTFDYKHMD